MTRPFEKTPCEVCAHAVRRYHGGSMCNPPEEESYCEFDMSNFDTSEGCFEFEIEFEK